MKILKKYINKVFNFILKNKIKREHNYNVSTTGKLIFQPDELTKKQKKQANWKRVAIVKLDDEISRYYCWFIKKRYDIDLIIPYRGTHLTVINDRVEFEIDFIKARRDYDAIEIHLEYATDVRTDGINWWLPARSIEAEQVREYAGFNSKPYFEFHITIGSAFEKQKEHSKYIRDSIVKHGDCFL